MAESAGSKGRYFGFIVAGLISLIVAVGGGWILNYLTEKRTILEYEVVNSEAFSGEKQNIAISTIDIRNSGKKELENLFCRITFPNAVISEYKITGIPKSETNVIQESSRFQLRAPFLNPGEKISVQLLLSLPSGKYEKPDIEVRGKGFVGKESIEGKGKLESKKETLFKIVATALLAIVSMMLLIFRGKTPRMFYSKKHRDDQRDIIAYILEVNGFLEESVSIRNSSRPLYYWAQADYLTQRWLATNNQQTIRQGIKCLQDLVDYASIENTSVLIINYDIARLAAAIDDVPKAKEFLSLALKGNHKVIIKRINLDKNLSKLHDTA